MITMTKLTALASTLYKLVDQYYILTGQNVNPNTDLRKILEAFPKNSEDFEDFGGFIPCVKVCLNGNDIGLYQDAYDFAYLYAEGLLYQAHSNLNKGTSINSITGHFANVISAIHTKDFDELPFDFEETLGVYDSQGDLKEVDQSLLSKYYELLKDAEALLKEFLMGEGR